MRLFLAVFPPSAVREAAHRVSESLRRPGDGVSWVKSGNLHYTLRFLGDVGVDGARRAAEAAREVAAGHTGFDACLGAAGAFPDAARARVIWQGLSEGEDALVSLGRTLERAVRTRGFEPADSPFTAHLTLGRVRTPGEDWGPRLAAARVEASAFRVDRLCVVESELSPAGARYTVRDEARLAD